MTNGGISMRRNSFAGTDLINLFIDFIKNFDLQEKRIDNFKKADSSIFAYNYKGDLVGVVFVFKKFYVVNNVTWLVSPNYRNRGVASLLVAEAQDEFRVLTAFTRNEASSKLAKKMHFFVFFKHFCIWLSFKPRIPSTSN
jgi:hypothetical protein